MQLIISTFEQNKSQCFGDKVLRWIRQVARQHLFVWLIFLPSFQSASKKTSGAATGSSDPAVSPGRVAGGGEGGGREGGGERGGGRREEGKKKEEEEEERLRLTSELQEIERERLAQTI